MGKHVIRRYGISCYEYTLFSALLSPCPSPKRGGKLLFISFSFSYGLTNITDTRLLLLVMWNLIDKLGKNNGIKPTLRNGVATDGKFLAMQLVMEGMAL